MFSHVMVGSNNIEKARKFYDAVLGLFGAGEPKDGEPATAANGGTIGFMCSSPEMVQQMHDVGVANGGTSIEDPPGVRHGSMGPMHLCYLRDPDGNKLCGMHMPGA